MEIGSLFLTVKLSLIIGGKSTAFLDFVIYPMRMQSMMLMIDDYTPSGPQTHVIIPSSQSFHTGSNLCRFIIDATSSGRRASEISNWAVALVKHDSF